MDSSAYDTRNIIIAVIDGVRDSEGVDDTTYQYIPFIGDSLKKMGSQYTEFYNTGAPMTSAAHEIILTGRRENLNNTRGSSHLSMRFSFPTMFECYRKDTGIPEAQCWIVSGKSNLSTGDYSLHPGYGLPYKASLLHTFPDDTTTMTAYLGILEQHHPRLSLLNLKDVDHVAHDATYSFEDYTRTIQRADSLVCELWKYLERDPFYRDSTLLMVITDHGRNEDSIPPFGYRNHGRPTHANRHLLFVAAGSDVKRDTVIATRRVLMDIAPTVAELQSFSMPFSEGKALHEMIIDYKEPVDRQNPPLLERERNLSMSALASLMPDITCDESGIHVVWSERVHADEEERNIKYIFSSDNGTTWAPQQTIMNDFVFRGCYPKAFVPDTLDSEDPNNGDFTYGFRLSNSLYGRGTPVYPVIERVGEGQLFVAVSGYSEVLDDVYGGRSFYWGVNILYNNDRGSIIRDGFCTIDLYIDNPVSLSFYDGTAWLIWTPSDKEMCAGEFYNNKMNLFRDISWLTKFSRFCEPAIGLGTDDMHIVYEVKYLESDTLFYEQYDAATHQLKLQTVIDGDIYPSAQPEIAIHEDKIHVVWSELDSSLNWEIVYARSTDNGITFSDQQLSDENHSAWHGDMDCSGDTIAIVWEDYIGSDTLSTCIKYRLSTDGGSSWFPSEVLSYSPSVASFPSVCIWEGMAHVVWQDLREGNWEIYFESIPIY